MGKADELVRGFLTPPLTVAELMKTLEAVPPDTAVFVCEIGNIYGSIKWKRKETPKQWAKRQSSDVVAKGDK